MSLPKMISWLLFGLLYAAGIRALKITICSPDSFLNYLTTRQDNLVRSCLSDTGTRNRLCNASVISGTIWELQIDALQRWKEGCELSDNRRLASPLSMVQANSGDTPRSGHRQGGTTRPPLGPLYLLKAGHYVGQIITKGKTGNQMITIQITDKKKTSPLKTAQLVKQPLNVRETITRNLPPTCGTQSTKLDECFTQGFTNAKELLKDQDPASIALNITGGVEDLSWTATSVQFRGFSNYTVVNTSSQASDRNSPLRLSTAWVGDRWWLELNITYRTSLLNGTTLFRIPSRVHIELPSIRLEMDSEIWGVKKPNRAGEMRFYSIDKRFQVDYDKNKTKASVKFTTWVEELKVRALYRLFDIHFRADVWPALWPQIQRKFSKTIQKIISGQAVPILIEYVIRKAAEEAARQAASVPSNQRPAPVTRVTADTTTGRRSRLDPLRLRPGGGAPTPRSGWPRPV